ncbi:MAG: MFS transporter [Deltaproteobacteria bacterium]|nr:MFS transporter [Deltaproteobacteria bacterium]
MPALPHSLRSLRHRDLQLFFSGQAISLVGTWMQSVAEGWLVYRLWSDATLLGWLSFLRQIPVFFLSAWAGGLADRMPRRKLVLATQFSAMVQAGALAWVTLAGHPTKFQLLGLAAALGVVNAFDIPSRQAYLVDMAGPDLENAIAFNSTLVNGTRVLGPAIAGYIVTAIGEGLCFFANSVSYVFVIVGLYFTRAGPPATSKRSRGGLVEGVRYAWNAHHARWPLLLVTCASLMAMPYVTLMPVFAKTIFHGNAATQGHLLGSAGVGAFLGAVSLLRRGPGKGLAHRVAWGASLLAAGLIGLSLAPNEWVAYGALVVTGFGFMSQMASTNTLLQSLAPVDMRGRVMGLYSMAFIGMGPFGSLLLGYAAAHVGARVAVGVGAATYLLASLVFRTVTEGIELAAQQARAERVA